MRSQWNTNKQALADQEKSGGGGQMNKKVIQLSIAQIKEKKR